MTTEPQLPWTKESPTIDGVYWWRADASDNDPDIHFVQGEFFYQVGLASSEVVANFGGEWLGPITPAPSDTEQGLREALDQVEAAMSAAIPYVPRDLEIALRERVKAARAALQPKAEPGDSA